MKRIIALMLIIFTLGLMLLSCTEGKNTDTSSGVLNSGNKHETTIVPMGPSSNGTGTQTGGTGSITDTGDNETMPIPMK